MSRVQCLRLAAVIASISHLIFLVWFVCWNSVLENNEDCVYATRSLAAQVQLGELGANMSTETRLRIRGAAAEPVSVGPFNRSLVYVINSDASLLYSPRETQDGRCFANTFHKTDMAAVMKVYPDGKNVVLVLEMADCMAYLWFFQVRTATAALLMYLAFLCVNRQRRGFGPWLDSASRVSAEAYYLNYWTTLAARVFLKVRYLKLSRFLREIEYRREQTWRQFSIDTLGFYLMHPLALLLRAIETILYFASLVASATVLRVNFDPCSVVLPNHVKVFAWVFVAALGALEVVSAIDHLRRETRSARDAAAVIRPTNIIAACCANIISHVLLRMLYGAALVLVVIGALKYEREIQTRLLG
ncbi:glycoprotein K [Psittacid alphaherpesvirus 1]|uniref:Envelope glycoprotein K n=1 Tax=Psittacid herpesvirus 1 (isolate Amazon parrot/-/97-0001/1997) TaxID=670426 RepID=GK_PSHV1|nr:envelope glycoprotein K [Psittacid alphaherpesvirus 1]Q6UDM3.1 RecName: Full=Envelope glycoprotein K; AltName: Full=Syncytial protein; Flags: Precursor [Psittacid herpesvirus 1 Amazon parrot/1997]AAQ73687.1 glycoprotein K [Psittacid alphaherpesvirus 1]